MVAASLRAAFAVLVILLAGPTAVSGFGYSGPDTEIRTYQAKMDVAFFPPGMAPPGTETFVVVYVMGGTFEPKSFLRLRATSYFEPQADGICEQRQYLIYTLAHAEVSISSNYILSSAEPATVLPSARMTPPFADIFATILMAEQYDPVTDTITYLVANGRMFEDSPYEATPEPVTVASIEANMTFHRIPNFEECPEIGLDP